jgi:hypothetical protein
MGRDYNVLLIYADVHLLGRNLIPQRKASKLLYASTAIGIEENCCLMHFLFIMV